LKRLNLKLVEIEKKSQSHKLQLGRILPNELKMLSDSLLDGREFNMDVKLSNEVRVCLDIEDMGIKVSDWEFIFNNEDVVWEDVLTANNPKFKVEKNKMKKDLDRFDKWVKQIAKENDMDALEIYDYLGWC